MLKISLCALYKRRVALVGTAKKKVEKKAKKNDASPWDVGIMLHQVALEI